MECSRTLTGVAIALFLQLLFDTDTINAGVLADDDVTQRINTPNHDGNIKWVFSDKSTSRNRRHLQPPGDDDGTHYFIEDKKCRESLERLCGTINDNNDDLFILQCVQTFKTNEAYMIDHDCQHSIWKHIVNLTENENIQRLTRRECGEDIDELCPLRGKEPGVYLACLIEKRESVKEQQCSEFIQRLEFVAFSDFRIITPMVTDCQSEIDKFKCGRIQPHRDISQGQMLACLQGHADDLENKCKKRIFKISEIQADNIKLDRQLFLACMQDHIKFCPNIRPGSGQVYKCLMHHKLDTTMSKQCADQLSRREKLIASDYRVSKGLAKACRDDIKSNHCRRSVSDDKEIKLAQILLCLETALKNGTKIDTECQKEMFDHRKILLEDYRLSPEIVDYCSKDILRYCNGLEVGGVTIHCLMDHTKSRKQKNKVSTECQRALEDLIKETDAGEDWRVDPVLHDACQPVVDSSCRDVQGGNARVIYCLMDKLGTDRMLEACESALLQIQYFVARDYKLDPQLYRACKADAIQLCHGKTAWSDDGSQMDPERGPLILPCLYRYADHQRNGTLRPECLQEIRRIMRQRAISVDLQPEIEEVCLSELAEMCFDKTAKGEEILCLQDNLDELNEKCKLAVSNLTEDQAERVELNPIIMAACRRTMDKHCEDVLKYGKDEGDMMDCLIEHKNEIDSHFEYKCKAAIEHFQIISLKNYHFTYKFKEACRPYVNRFCHRATTKAKVIECLSDIVRQDIMSDSQHRILKDCRQQLRSQLYQQRENINLDPLLKKACLQEIEIHCHNIEPGNSQILECLASHKSKLGSSCHKQLFKVRQQEFLDSSSDFLLWNTCRSMIWQFCQKEPDKTKAFDCLKGFKDEDSFDDKCKDLVVRRMIEQNTDYRFNGALHAACSHDILGQCKKVVENEPADKELEGKVVRCLRIKFREGKLRPRCQKQITIVLKQAAHNYHLNPLLVAMCSHEIDTICHSDDDDSDTVEECLKTHFNEGNPEMREECKVEIADLIEEARADIHFDPLLHKACSNDVAKYCSDVPQGAGRHIKCLQIAMDDNKKTLEPDCYKMLSKRIEMFKNVAKLNLPDTLGQLYTTVNESPSRGYFIIIAVTLIGWIFVIGLLCGRVTRRTIATMKNK